MSDRLSIDIPSKEKSRPKGRLFLLFCIVVLSLAGWPLSFWLIFGAACADGRNRRDARRLLSADTSQPPISSTQGVEEILIACNDADALQELRRVR